MSNEDPQASTVTTWVVVIEKLYMCSPAGFPKKLDAPEVEPETVPPQARDPLKEAEKSGTGAEQKPVQSVELVAHRRRQVVPEGQFEAVRQLVTPVDRNA